MGKEFQKIPVICPKCKERVMYWNGITMIQVATQCRNCGAYVIFNPADKEKQTRVKQMPIRESSSGVRFR